MVDLLDSLEEDRWTGVKFTEGPGILGAVRIAEVCGSLAYLVELPLGIMGRGASSEDTRACGSVSTGDAILSINREFWVTCSTGV